MNEISFNANIFTFPLYTDFCGCWSRANYFINKKLKLQNVFVEGKNIWLQAKHK